MQSAKQFDRRLGKISKAHDRAQNGIAYRVSRSGLIEARPRRFRPKFPLKGIVVLSVTLLSFKGFLLAYLGPGIYQSRLDLLANGALVEKAGAWVLQVEPATRAFADMFQRLGV